MSASAAEVLAIATVVPPYVCSRARSVAIAKQVFAGQPEALALATRLFAASGIERRYSVLADFDPTTNRRSLFAHTADWRPEPSTFMRNELYRKEAPGLARRACEGLANSDWTGRVTHLITASCTGFSAPGFDIDLARDLGLSPRLHRSHIGFMGCYAGFSTLKLARLICQAEPEALVLIVHVELCSLHVRFCPDAENLVANALFADGVAAALVGGKRHENLGSGPPLAILGAGAFLLPGSADDMTWAIGDLGFRMTISPRVPHLLRAHLPAAHAALLDETKVERARMRHYAVHPGGPAILDAALQALGIGESDVAVSREVLRDYGNMSSATLWFLLERIRRRPQAGLVYACGFGPGLTLESALLGHPGCA